MHKQPAFINDPDANQFREMCWGCGGERAVLVVEKEGETEIIGGVWCWLCYRSVHNDCLAEYHSLISGCRNPDCPLFPPS